MVLLYCNNSRQSACSCYICRNKKSHIFKIWLEHFQLNTHSIFPPIICIYKLLFKHSPIINYFYQQVWYEMCTDAVVINNNRYYLIAEQLTKNNRTPTFKVKVNFRLQTKVVKSYTILSVGFMGRPGKSWKVCSFYLFFFYTGWRRWIGWF